MKIYVITKGCYSDYRICGVTESKEKAEHLAILLSDNWDTAEVEEYDTEEYKDFLQFENIFKCTQRISWGGEKSIDVRKVAIDWVSQTEEIFDVERQPNGDLITYVDAKEQGTALKIASDRFAKYNAQILGL